VKIKIPLSKVMSTGAFSLYTSKIDNKTYVTPGWVEVPNNTQSNDIEIIYPNKPINLIARKEFKVKGSTGTMYTVIIDPNLGNYCDCVGFGYHRSCKHIKSKL